jgi:hypothetical protein
MKVIFQKVEKAITSCPKRKKLANINQCKKCDDGTEIRGNIHCLFNNPVGVCISSIGIALGDSEVYAVEINSEFNFWGGRHISWPVANGVIGEPVYASQSKGYYCKRG